MDESLNLFSEKLEQIVESQLLDEREELQNIENLIKFLYSNCEEKLARILTINLIITTGETLSQIYGKILHNILQRYHSLISQNNENSMLLKKIIFVEVSDDLWTECFNIVTKFHAIDIEVLNNLFQIKRPENQKRELIITKFVTGLIADKRKEKFLNGLKWIEKFNLEKLTKDNYENIIYRALLYGIPEVLKYLLTTKKLKETYVKILDECYEEKLDTKFCYNEFKEIFIEKSDVETLKSLVYLEAIKYNIDIDRPGFNIYHRKVLDQLKEKFHHSDKSKFEEFALNTIRNYKGFNKCDFINIFIDDPKYAYSWAKYLKIEEWETPYFVKICGNDYQNEAENFKKELNKRLESPQDPVCTIFGRDYKLIQLTTPETLNEFIQTYFIDSKPSILGIACETHKYKLSLIQLATSHWVTIIDVKILSDFLSDSEWMSLFDQLFNPEITLIGLDFQTNFSFFDNTYPFFAKWITEGQKVLCLSKLFKAVYNNFDAKNVVFTNTDQRYMKEKSNLSLSDISERILNFKLDQQFLRCTWKWRPLTKQQQVYAVTDAVVLLLIKEKNGNYVKKASQ